MSSEDIKVVSEVLNGILNPNNDIRNLAVAKLDELRTNTPGLIYCLLKVLEGILKINIFL
jgi:hypothetical protein